MTAFGKSSTSGYTRKGEQLVREDDLFLTRLIITNDDVKRYYEKKSCQKLVICKKVLNNKIIVCIIGF